MNGLTEKRLKILNAIVEYRTDDAGPPPIGGIYGIQAEKPWAIATNGQYLLAFGVEGLSGELPTINKVKIASKIKGWLDHSEGLQEVSFQALLDWCKEGDYLKCPCCDGSGGRLIDLGKKFIEGSWIDPFENIDGGSFGLIAGVPISRNLMVQTLAYLPMGSGRVSISEIPAEKDNPPSLLIVGDGWRYIQCAVKVTPEEFEALERFKE